MEQKFYQVYRCFDYGLDQSESAEMRLITMLRKIPEERAIILLHDFEKNIKTNGDKIRNPTAYFMGMMNKVMETLDAPDSIRVQQRLDRFYHNGKLRPDDLDDRCRDALKQLPEMSAMEVLHELDTTDLSSIVNIPAFFLSLTRKYSAGGGDNRRHMGGNDGYHSPRRNEGAIYTRDRDMGGGGYPPMQQHRQGGGGFPPPMMLLPAPGAIPRDLLYGFAEDEYRPEMPRVGCRTVHVCNYALQVTMGVCGGIVSARGLGDSCILMMSLMACYHVMYIASNISPIVTGTTIIDRI